MSKAPYNVRHLANVTPGHRHLPAVTAATMDILDRFHALPQPIFLAVLSSTIMSLLASTNDPRGAWAHLRRSLDEHMAEIMQDGGT